MIASAPGWVQALVLGVVQGLTEFVPVSSSGHLVLVPALTGWERQGLTFDVALHVGTLLALLLYYRVDLWRMLCAVLSRQPSRERDEQRRLVVLLAVASVPVAVAGLALGSVVEEVFSAPRTTAWLLLGTAAVLIGGERLARHRWRSIPVPATVPDRVPGDPAAATTVPRGTARDAAPAGLGSALLIGVAQAFALLPGLSRSGLTISAGVVAGLSRTAATRFAFLLGLPAMAGAAVVELPHIDDLGAAPTTDLVVGVAAAAVSGYLAIALLVRLVSRVGIDRFAPYVVALSIVSLFVLS